MKRANNLLSVIADMENIRIASWRAAKGKRYAKEVMDFQSQLEANCLEIQHQLLSGKVTVGDYRYFKVFEPKERQICASAFREQVIHHSLMNLCHPVFERAQVYDSYASRIGKGVYAALQRAKGYTCSRGWYLKMDVRKYFDSIHHDVLKRQLGRLFKEEKLLQVMFQIIDSYEASPARGLPIGNLTSQYFANHYLSPLDHFVKENLRCKAYVRYMDDLVCWSNDKSKLREWHKAITEFSEMHLRIALKPESLNWSARGLPFLGYRVFPRRLTLLHKSKHRYIRKMSRIHRKYHKLEWTQSACGVGVRALNAFIGHADTHAFRKSVCLRLYGQTP